MNRRDFFGVLGAGAAMIAVPELLSPKRTYFLPPIGGWRSDSFKMRYVENYCINSDTIVGRFDVCAKNIGGGVNQFIVDVAPKFYRPHMPEFERLVAAPARARIAREFQLHGLTVYYPSSTDPNHEIFWPKKELARILSPAVYV